MSVIASSHPAPAEGWHLCVGPGDHLPRGCERSAPGTQYLARTHCCDPWTCVHQPPGRHHRPSPHLCVSSFSLRTAAMHLY